jgi:hypothetical protein
MQLAAPIILISISCLLSACTNVEVLRDGAEHGNTSSELVFAYAYETGTYGLPRDYASAEKWYEAAAAGGEPFADCALGGLYHRGLGVAKDDEKAIQWYLKAHSDGARVHLFDPPKSTDGAQLESLLRAAIAGDRTALREIGKIDLRVGRELALTLLL